MTTPEGKLAGLHHVTALAGDPQRNLHFYTRFLGLRLVKRTVNYDDPAAYHFYYGDPCATPGKLITFFPWPNARHGRIGSGQAVAVAFSVRRESLSEWKERAESGGLPCSGPSHRFGEEYLTIQDPEGIALELVAGIRAEGIRIAGLDSVTLLQSDPARVTALLVDTLGFHVTGQEGNRTRFAIGREGPGTRVDVVHAPGTERGKTSAGIVHHIALRTSNEETLLAWREKILAAGLKVTAVRDRQYFRSIYFREPGGVLFEIATDGPGFFIDEKELGQALRLPPWLEPVRDQVERRLPAVDFADLRT